MKIEVLVPTIDQVNFSLVKKMNIQSDAIISNQANRVEYISYKQGENNISFYTFNERGVGLNRNNLLMRSTAEICVFADDDMRFIDNYPQIVNKIFLDNPDADVILFNIEDSNENRYTIKKKFKVNFFNFMRFGGGRIAFRRKAITKNGIFFNLNFGGGTEFSAGEDVLFISDCLKKKLNVVAVPFHIAELLDNRDSTWFKGINNKFFFDKGVLYATLSRKYCKLISLQFAIRRYSLYKEDITFIQAMKEMLNGIKYFDTIR